MHYLLFYEASEDYLAKRARFRSEHLAKAWQAAQRGELLLGGAFADPVDGAVLLFKGESRSVAEEFARADPYVAGGAVKRWYVREWTTVVGGEAAAPIRPEQLTSAVPSTAASDRNAEPADPIMRIWRGRSTAERAGDYIPHVTGKVFPQLNSISGFRGAYLFRRSVESGVEFLVLTRWESMAAVQSFAGLEPEKAVVEPAARAALTEFAEIVAHYEVVSASIR
jgi:uncharacterized protein YciI/heme-degrading monooxygenase HmoA